MPYSTQQKKQLDKVRHFYKTAFACDDLQIPTRFNTIDTPWLVVFSKTEAINPAQVDSFISATWTDSNRVPALGTSELLRPTIMKIIDTVCDYQDARYNRMPFRNGSLGDPTNLVFEFIKEKCIDISNINPADFATVIAKGGLIYRMIQFLKRIERSHVFPPGTFSTSTRVHTVFSIRCDLEQLSKKIALFLEQDSAREDLNKLTDSSARLLHASIAYLHFILRNAARPEQKKELQCLLTPDTIILREMMDTGIGKVIQGLLKRPSLQKYISLEYPDLNTEEVKVASSNYLTVAGTQDCFLPIVETLQQSIQDKTTKGSGIDPYFLEPTNVAILQNFAKLYGLTTELAKFVVITKQAFSLAGQGGNILVYGLMGKSTQRFVQSFSKLVAELSECIDHLVLVTKRRYGELLLANQHPAWEQNYFLAENSLEEFYEGHSVCIRQIANIHARASKGISLDELEKIKQETHEVINAMELCATRWLGPSEEAKEAMPSPAGINLAQMPIHTPTQANTARRALTFGWQNPVTLVIEHTQQTGDREIIAKFAELIDQPKAEETLPTYIGTIQQRFPKTAEGKEMLLQFVTAAFTLRWNRAYQAIIDKYCDTSQKVAYKQHWLRCMMYGDDTFRAKYVEDNLHICNDINALLVFYGEDENSKQTLVNILEEYLLMVLDNLDKGQAISSMETVFFGLVNNYISEEFVATYTPSDTKLLRYKNEILTIFRKNKQEEAQVKDVVLNTILLPISQHDFKPAINALRDWFVRGKNELNKFDILLRQILNSRDMLPIAQQREFIAALQISLADTQRSQDQEWVGFLNQRLVDCSTYDMPLIAGVIYQAGANPLSRDERGFSLLHNLALNGRVNILQTLIGIYKIVPQLSQDKSTLLHSAIAGWMGEWKRSLSSMHEYHSLVDWLIKLNPSYIKAVTAAGWSPLFMAVRYGNVTLASMLLEHDADVNIVTNDGQSCLQIAMQYSYPELIELILAQPQLDLTYKDIDGNNHVHLAVCYGRQDLISPLVLKAQGLLEGKNDRGLTPLFYALVERKETAIPVLLELGAALEIANDYVLEAKVKGRMEAGKIYIEKSGDDLKYYVLDPCHIQQSGSILNLLQSCPEIADKIAKPLNVDTITPLLPNMLLALMKRQHISYRISCLQVAIGLNLDVLIRMLLKRQDIELGLLDSTGNNYVQLAICSKKRWLVEELVSRNPELIQGNSGIKAIKLAERIQADDILECLKSKTELVKKKSFAFFS